jgi:hypothetical protein
MGIYSKSAVEFLLGYTNIRLLLQEVRMSQSDIVAWAQVIANVAMVLTFVIYWRQLVALRSQVRAAREASRTQNLIALIDFIQRPTHVESRRVLINLDGRPLSNWTDDERRSAERACSAWDAVAILLRHDSMQEAAQIVLSTWKTSIAPCYTVASKELLGTLRTMRGTDFWDDFEWLAQKALGEINDNGSI